MFKCPSCGDKLWKQKGKAGVFWSCRSCGGRSSTIAVLQRITPANAATVLWFNSNEESYPRIRDCPACGRKMTQVPILSPYGSINVDACSTCQFVWFDSSEYEQVCNEPATCEETLSQEMREKIAMAKVKFYAAKAAEGAHEETPDEAWKMIPALFGLPVEYNSVRLSRIPAVTWILAGILLVIGWLTHSNLDAIVATYGMVPSKLGELYGVTLITAFFLHAGQIHLFSNVYFLLAFGDNVEDVLGRWRFVLLLFLATLVGNLVHVFCDMRMDIPCIGASGGISAVIVYYGLKFPKAKLGFLNFLSFFRFAQIPASAMLLVWIGLQVIGAWKQVEGLTAVSSLAHLGGAAVGFVFWLLTIKERR